MASRSKKKPRKRKPTGRPAKSEIESAILTFIAGTAANVAGATIWHLIQKYILND